MDSDGGGGCSLLNGSFQNEPDPKHRGQREGKHLANATSNITCPETVNYLRFSHSEQRNGQKQRTVAKGKSDLDVKKGWNDPKEKKSLRASNLDGTPKLPILQNKKRATEVGKKTRARENHDAGEETTPGDRTKLMARGRDWESQPERAKGRGTSTRQTADEMQPGEAAVATKQRSTRTT